MVKRGDLVGSQLRKWAEDLVDLTRNNRLLYFAHTQTSSFEFAQDSLEIEGSLARSGYWAFHLPADPTDDEDPPLVKPPAPNELVVSMKPERHRSKIERGLRNPERAANAEFLDAGIWATFWSRK